MASVSFSSGDWELSPVQIAHLLGEFLISTQSVMLNARIVNAQDLPSFFKPRAREAESQGKIWAAWSTDRGPMLAWATHDRERSALLRAYVLLIDWYLAPDVHHAGWWHCQPAHHRDWTYGRGHPQPEWRE